jgi:iron complex outermembrane receptor protein
MFFNYKTCLSSCLASAMLSSVAYANTPIEEIVVESTLTPISWKQASSGLSIIDANAIKNNNATFIADILTQAPNVNFSSGASRGRFFQIRGTGERSQFTDPINPSVGVSIDGLDFSGAANVAGLFDIRRIEILRGPQGTAFGTNASAGLINILSNDPSDEYSTTLSGSIGSVSGNKGEIDSYQSGVVINGALSDSVNGRLALQKLENDGFTNNLFLNRDDTTKIDEATARAKLHWQANDDLVIKTTLLYSDVDNGYDGFTLDNVRDTITDEPGFDQQETTAFIISSDYTLGNNRHWILNVSHADAKVDYGYDEDWTFTGIHPDGYTSFDRYFREINNTTIDTRLINDINDDIQWTSGLYFRDQTVDLERTYSFDSPFLSEYQTTHFAAYGEISFDSNEALNITIGARVEDFEADYRDNRNETSSPTETLWGGHISANYRLSNELALFSRLSKGFKAAGVNSENGNVIPANNSIYDTESLYNAEIGANFGRADGSLVGQLTAFYQERHDAQIKQSLALSQANNGSCPCDFEDFIDNANETEHFGIELEGRYQLASNIQLFASAGYLKAEFSDYVRISEGLTDEEFIEDLNGRQVANAPEYQYAIGTDWSINENLSLWLQVEGRDDYFFSNRHEVRSQSYTLLNSTLSYQRDNWEVALWGKNLANEDYTVRGFGEFGNDPRNSYTNEPYLQFGMPREVGISASIRFD